MKARSILATIVVLVVANAAHAQAPPIRTADLAHGRYATMSALVEKTIFSIDAFRVTMRFGDRTARELEALAKGHDYSETRASRIAQTAYLADDVYVRVVFERDIDFDRFVDGVRDNLQKAYEARMISGATRREVSTRVPQWFHFLESRGIREGEQLLYRVSRDEMRTVYLDTAGNEMLDQTDAGEKAPRTMLAGYFAPGTDAREPLVRSLFD